MKPQHRDLWSLTTPVSEATVDLVLLAALMQFKCQATNRLLLAAPEEYGDSGTTQIKDVKKTPAKNATINSK